MEYNKGLFESLSIIAKKYESLTKQIESENLSIDQIRELNRQIKKNKPIYEGFKNYEKLVNNAKQALEILNQKTDLDLHEMAQMELDEITSKIPDIEEQLKILLLPVDPNNDKNVIIEMRPAAGGDEASIFVADLFDTYKRYADKQK